MKLRVLFDITIIRSSSLYGTQQLLHAMATKLARHFLLQYYAIA